MNFIDQIAPDKRGHVVAGSLIASAAATATIYNGQPHQAWLAATVIAITAAFAKEGFDAYSNHQATGKWLGDPRGTPHGVELWDAVATIVGGLLVAVPLMFV